MKHTAGSITLGALLLLVLGLNQVSWGQKPPPPVPPNPQAPVLQVPFPAGIQRGTNITLTLTGANLAGPTGILAGFPAKIDIPTDNKNGLDNAKLQVRLDVPADVPIGYYPLQLATTRGMSNVRLFCIDDLPQVVEVDSNRNKATPQSVPIPCVVAGRTDAEQGDFYKISVKAKQRLSFDVLGRRLGGPIDPQISIFSVRTGREIAHDNDAPGCQGDPRLTYTFKEAGDYLIEVKDVLFRGGADYCYRLRIGDFPCATAPLPMAARRGRETIIRFVGPYVAGVLPFDLRVTKDMLTDTEWFAPKGPTGLHGWPVALRLSDHLELLEQEPNNDGAKANRLPVPGGITGRFEQSDDLDCFVFSAKKGQKVLVEAHTLESHSPTLVYMVLKNAKSGAEVGKSNPQAAPPLDQRIAFTAPDDGDYLLEVQHLNYLGGPSEVYRITVTPTVPDFELALGIDRYDLAPDSFAALALQVNRQGYTGPIDVEVEGPPGITGSTTIKPNQASGLLLVQAQPDVAMGPYMIQVSGKAKIDGRVVTRVANVRSSIVQSLAGLQYPPRTLYNHIAVAVREKAPFTLAARFDPPEGVPGLPANLIVSAKRLMGFDEEIALNPLGGLPASEKPQALKPIAKGKDEIKLQIPLTAKIPLGDHLIFVTGKAKQKDKEYSASAMPVSLSVGPPFVLKVEGPLKLAAGDKDASKLKVIATRKGGYDGPIDLEVKNLPANVTADKAAIAKGSTTGEIVIRAAESAAAGTKADVQVIGKAATGKLQNTSPNFTVIVEKKKL